MEGAHKLLLAGERQKFLTEEWPRISARIQRLGLAAKDLLHTAPPKSSSKKEDR
jgi:GntR family transcriptional regulator